MAAAPKLAVEVVAAPPRDSDGPVGAGDKFGIDRTTDQRKDGLITGAKQNNGNSVAAASFKSSSAP